MDKRYRSGVEVTAELIGGKWRAVLLAYLEQGPRGDAELRRRLPEPGEPAIGQVLRELEAEGLVRRHEESSGPAFVLTEEGRTLGPVLRAMQEWGVARARRHDLEIVEPGRADTRRLAAASLAQGDATGWFERLYAEA